MSASLVSPHRGFAIGGLLVLVLVLGGTLAAFGLVAGGFEDRSTKFWIAMGTILFAEAIAFGLPLTWPLQRRALKGSFPFDFAAIPIIGLYLVSVIVLGLVALTPITPEWLGALHVAVGVIALALLVLYQSGKSYITASTEGDARAVRAYDEARLIAARTAISANGLDGECANAIQECVDRIKADLEFAAADSVPSASRDDLALLEGMNELEAFVESLGARECLMSDADEVGRITGQISRVIQRREASIAMAR